MKKIIFIFILLTGLAPNLTKDGWGIIAFEKLSAESWDGDLYIFVFQGKIDVDEEKLNNSTHSTVEPLTPPTIDGFDTSTPDIDNTHIDIPVYNGGQGDNSGSGYSESDDDGGYDDGIGENDQTNDGINDPTDDHNNNESGNEQPESESSKYDCAGVLNGTAYFDNCKECVGGTTGKSACCKTTKEELKLVFPNATDANLQTLADLLNKYGSKFGLDTKEKKQHFLAQTAVESKYFNTLTPTESLYYKTGQRLIVVFPTYFSYTNSNKRNPDSYLKNSELVANYVYASRMGNGLEGNGNGYRYIGRGLMQLTGKDNYAAFNNFYNSNYSNSTNFVSSPDQINSSAENSLISALWFFKENVLDKININSSTPVYKVSRIVNGGKNGLPEREKIFKTLQSYIDCN